MAAAALGMGLLLVPARATLEAMAGTSGLVAQLTTGLLPVLLGVLAYLGLARAFRLPEASALFDLLRRVAAR
jgi:hypothetical protein